MQIKAKDAPVANPNNPAASEVAQAQQQAGEQPPAGGGDHMHTVQQGDNLSSIAEANKTTVEKIAADNKIPDPNHIEAGQELSIASPSSQPSSSKDISSGSSGGNAEFSKASVSNHNDSKGGGSYTIESGDTLSEIAADHGTSTHSLASHNDIDNPDDIKAGDSIDIAGDHSHSHDYPTSL